MPTKGFKFDICQFSDKLSVLIKVLSSGDHFIGDITIATATDERFPVYIKTTIVQILAKSLAVLNNHSHESLKVNFSKSFHCILQSDFRFRSGMIMVYKPVLKCRHQPRILDFIICLKGI